MPRQAKPLTQHSISSAHPTDRPFELTDGKVRGLVYRVQPSGVRTWSVVVARKRYRIGSGDMTLGAARTRAMAYITAGGPPPEPDAPDEVPTLGSFIEGRYGEHFKATHARPKSHLNNLTQSILGDDLRDKKLDMLTPSVLDTFVAKRLRTGVSRATVRRNVTAIKALVSTAVRWGVLPGNSLIRYTAVKGADNKRVRYLVPAEAKKLDAALKKSPDWLRDLFALCVNTGLRQREALTLEGDDVDMPGKVLHVRGSETKPGRGYVVPLNKSALAVVNRRASPGQPLFPGAGKNRHMSNIGKAWRDAVTRAGLGGSGLTWHGATRHTFASRLVTGGVDLYTVGRLLNHSDPKLTQRYSHLAPNTLVAAVKKLDARK